jgi:hypothetical protein
VKPMAHQNVRSKPAASLVAVAGPVTDIISAAGLRPAALTAPLTAPARAGHPGGGNIIINIENEIPWLV